MNYVSFDTFLGTLSNDFQRRGTEFEEFCKWFLQNSYSWKSLVKRVWLWNEYPNRWGRDCGIDLVYEDDQGGHWAVQAKCYDHAYDIKKSDLDTFLSESNRRNITGRLLLASTDGFGKNAQQVCAAQEKPVVRFLLSDFRALGDAYPPSLLELVKPALFSKSGPVRKGRRQCP
jgi:predicted helicase